MDGAGVCRSDDGRNFATRTRPPTSHPRLAPAGASNGRPTSPPAAHSRAKTPTQPRRAIVAAVYAYARARVAPAVCRDGWDHDGQGWVGGWVARTHARGTAPGVARAGGGRPAWTLLLSGGEARSPPAGHERLGGQAPCRTRAPARGRGADAARRGAGGSRATASGSCSAGWASAASSSGFWWERAYGVSRPRPEGPGSLGPPRALGSLVTWACFLGAYSSPLCKSTYLSLLPRGLSGERQLLVAAPPSINLLRTAIILPSAQLALLSSCRCAAHPPYSPRIAIGATVSPESPFLGVPRSSIDPGETVIYRWKPPPLRLKYGRDAVKDKLFGYVGNRGRSIIMTSLVFRFMFLSASSAELPAHLLLIAVSLIGTRPANGLLRPAIIGGGLRIRITPYPAAAPASVMCISPFCRQAGVRSAPSAIGDRMILNHTDLYPTISICLAPTTGTGWIYFISTCVELRTSANQASSSAPQLPFRDMPCPGAISNYEARLQVEQKSERISGYVGRESSAYVILSTEKVLFHKQDVQIERLNLAEVTHTQREWGPIYREGLGASCHVSWSSDAGLALARLSYEEVVIPRYDNTAGGDVFTAYAERTRMEYGRFYFDVDTDTWQFVSTLWYLRLRGLLAKWLAVATVCKVGHESFLKNKALTTYALRQGNALVTDDVRDGRGSGTVEFDAYNRHP
ncbi:hypothetical protein BU17DRAFT_62333 [Hysterangium stoloniferum]|nr:hypothetical protein BU17DRAFT_62333 [Hysterangium stoloniferum]